MQALLGWVSGVVTTLLVFWLADRHSQKCMERHAALLLEAKKDACGGGMPGCPRGPDCNSDHK